jgi:nitrite reductase (NADH) small subunit
LTRERGAGRLGAQIIENRNLKRENGKGEPRMAFVRAAAVVEIPAGEIRAVQVGEKEVALAHMDGKFFAISNECLHRGGPLGEGSMQGPVVTCPWHGWEFDVTTGKACLNPEVGVQTYAVEIRGDEVFVDVG